MEINTKSSHNTYEIRQLLQFNEEKKNYLKKNKFLVRQVLTACCLLRLLLCSVARTDKMLLRRNSVGVGRPKRRRETSRREY